MKYNIVPVFLIFLLLSCQNSEPESSHKIFQRLSTAETAIDFTNKLVESDSLNFLTFSYIYMGGGVSAGDINNDGLTDLYFTGNMVPNKLYLNKGNLTFEDISVTAGVAGDHRWFTGVTMADVNNDGFLDIYCSVGGKFEPKNNLLFINNGDLTFTESARDYGIDDPGNSIQSTFFDYDLDGDLDLYVANYPPTNFDAPNNYFAYKMSNPRDDETDKLFRNDGDSFTDVTSEARIRSYGLSNSATAGDLNGDGWPDLYVSNDFSMPDFILINNRDGTFSERSKELTTQTARYGTGVDLADFNNDQLLDILQLDMAPSNNRQAKSNMPKLHPDLFRATVDAGFHHQYVQNQLQMNNGMFHDSMPSFSNVAGISGLAATDRSWGTLLADLDNDGWKDVFISNGIRREIYNRDYFNKLKKTRISKDEFLEVSMGIPSEKIDNYVFKNNGDLTFTKMNIEWGLEFKGWSNGCVYADLDNDGDLEVILNNIDDNAAIFENFSADQNNYISLNFKGPEKNRSGLGVKAVLKSNGLTQYQEMTLSRGFQSSVAPRLHFGIGKAEHADLLKITWPDGKIQTFEDIEKNQFLTIDYANADVVENKKLAAAPKLFQTERDPSVIVSHKHAENDYDDFKYQVMLPHQLSALGPGTSVGDVNGDGLDDFVISGAHNNQTAIFYQIADGFERQHFPDIDNDSDREDLGCLIFDADGDGFNDLYVVSGGNEFDYDSELLIDRLYLNDGKGHLTVSDAALPKIKISGSRVLSCDYDKDGDLDLFVGGRLIPKNYPLPPNSYLLENKSTPGNPLFVNASVAIAPGLNDLGMVTDASWTDIDNDGWTDLIIVGEWMPITIFRNNKGQFDNITENLGLDDTNGLWFSIAEGDFDKDGDKDFIVGNLGLNYNYKAAENESFDLYFNDFDKNKSYDIVLSYTENGEKYPLKDRMYSSKQIPAIAQKFKDNTSFAVANLEDIYTKKSLRKSLHYQVQSFSSIYLENKGNAFTKHNLPNLAQLSNINQILVEDFNADGKLDIVIAGNMFGSEVETPRNDAGVGLYLKGDGKGGFTPLTPVRSGLFIPGDTKDLALISIRNKTYILAAKNDDNIQFIEVKKEK